MLLGGMAVSTGYLVANKKITASCSVASTCKGCGIYSECKNPQVKTEREKITP